MKKEIAYTFAIPRHHCVLLVDWPGDIEVKMILSIFGGIKDFDKLKAKEKAMGDREKLLLGLMLYESLKQEKAELQMQDMKNVLDDKFPNQINWELINS